MLLDHEGETMNIQEIWTQPVYPILGNPTNIQVSI